MSQWRIGSRGSDLALWQSLTTLRESNTAQLGTLMSEEKIADLPLNARNFTQLLSLTPGTAPVSVDTIWINGSLWTVTWTTVTNWTATVPLFVGSNTFSVVGVNPNGQAISGSISRLMVAGVHAHVS